MSDSLHISEHVLCRLETLEPSNYALEDRLGFVAAFFEDE